MPAQPARAAPYAFKEHRHLMFKMTVLRTGLVRPDDPAGNFRRIILAYPAFGRRPQTSDNARMFERARRRLCKRANRGLRGYSVATVALYGPNDTRATKLTVGIVSAEVDAV